MNDFLYLLQMGLGWFLFLLSMTSYDVRQWEVGCPFSKCLLSQGELEVVSDRTCSILEYLGHQNQPEQLLLSAQIPFFRNTRGHSLCYPPRNAVMGKAVRPVALLCYAVDSGSFPSHWVSNLDRYVWLSLFLWSNSFIGIPSTNISRTCVYCLCLIWSIITVLVFQTKLSGHSGDFQVDSKPQARKPQFLHLFGI